MSVAKQAIAARRRARRDTRYIGQSRKDAVKRALKEREKVEREKMMKQRKKK